MKHFAQAFIKAQAEMSNAKKDASNPFLKNSYATLNSVREACIPALNANGIAVLQPIVQIEGKNFVKTLLLHESGESMESLTEIVYSKQNDAQAQGSGITYARRYGLQSLVNIGAEDDDGNKASEKPKSNIARIAEVVDGDMADIQRKANEKNFEIIKSELLSCETAESLELVKSENKKALNTLSKYAPDLFAELSAIKQRQIAKFDIKI